MSISFILILIDIYILYVLYVNTIIEFLHIEVGEDKCYTVSYVLLKLIAPLMTRSMNFSAISTPCVGASFKCMLSLIKHGADTNASNQVINRDFTLFSKHI